MAKIRLNPAGGGRLALTRPGQAAVPVVPRPCFPWSSQARLISLRDEKGEELALVDDPWDLDGPSREALLWGLAQSSFVLDITRIKKIETEMEIRNWRVATRQGADLGDVLFQTHLDDWPSLLPDGGLLIRDISGTLYRIADPAALDAKSKKLLWAYVD